MKQNKKIVFGMLILTIFILVVSLSSFYVQTQVEAGNVCGCVIPIYLFLPLLASIGLFIGTLVYYLLSPILEKKVDVDAFLRPFDKREKQLLRILIEKGSKTQAYFVRNTDMSKVKIYRTLKSLEQRDIIKKKKHGKTNKIYLDKDIKDLFR